MPAKVFISYSHKDEEWKQWLELHLCVLRREDLLGVWSDKWIQAGHELENEIGRALDSTDVAILVVSVSSLTSDFILDEEVPKLLKRRGLLLSVL